MEAQAKTKIALNMLQDGMSCETVAKYAEILIETLKEWMKEAGLPVNGS